MNWLDGIIILVLAYYAFMGTRRGLIIGLLEFLGLIVSIAVPFLLHVPGGHVLERLGVSRVFSGALAFLIIWLITSNVYFFAARRFYRRVPRGVRISPANRVLGIIPGLARGVIVIALILMIMVALPTALISQRTIDRSTVGLPLLNGATVVTSYAADIFGEAVRTALGFLTVEPKSDERVALRFRVANPVIDPATEEQMLRLVNRERVEHGLSLLVMDETLRQVARKHSIDMFRRGYFSHDTPEGTTPFQRMERGGARFIIAGENLALAPTVNIAHSGLMQSPGHRANILRPQFRRVGIGVARGGRYGMMFTQDFSD